MIGEEETRGASASLEPISLSLIVPNILAVFVGGVVGIEEAIKLGSPFMNMSSDEQASGSQLPSRCRLKDVIMESMIHR